LVRRLVPEECEEYTPDEKERKELERVFGIDGENGWKAVFALVNEAQAAFEKPKTSKLTLWRPKAELAEGHTGYRGRMGIYEALRVSSEVQRMIVASGTSEEIQNEAIKEGMITMQVDGLIKAMLGMTTIEEILRVTRE
jgi:type II secretory ATPase GspE/PulE/Tfp pilus assembly ATPase PilB-like protein